MTNKEKQRIVEMRKEGYSYESIAKKINLARSTVSSFCSRNDIDKKSSYQYKNCKCCGGLFEQKPNRKEKKFCSKECCQKWWNDNLNEVNHKANYSFVCLNCGKAFTSYGVKNRKYCSFKCYIKNRYRKRGEHHE